MMRQNLKHNFWYFYKDEIRVPFYSMGFCLLCEGSALMLFPNGKDDGIMLMQCNECRKESILTTSFIVTAN